MTMIDPVAVVVEALTAAGHTDVHPTEQIERISSEALSADEYIWVEEEVGTTPHIRYADRPAVSVVVYSTDNARARSQVIQRDLQNAQGTAFASGGIHRVITVIRPYRQDIAGLPPGVARVSATYELILSSLEKWS